MNRKLKKAINKFLEYLPVIFAGLMLLLILIGEVSAAEIPTYKQGQAMEITATCDNCTTGVNLTQLIFPNGTFALRGQFSMTKNGTTYNYTYTPHTIGTYKYVTCGDLDGTLTCSDTIDREFEVNSVGTPFTTQKSIMYIGLLTLLIFMFILDLMVAFKLPSGNNKDMSGQILSINNLKYLRPILFGFAYVLIIVIMFVSSNLSFAFLGENMFGKLFFAFYTIMFKGLIIVPFIWIIWLFAKIAQDKEIKNMIERGVPVGRGI